jgi:DNA primase
VAIDDASIERVRKAADIVAVVGEYVRLKRAGRNHVGLCPFHEEKTPSFNVNPARQFYHCFGCGVGGDVFSFVMEMENLDFPESVRLLAQRYNVQITETGRRDDGSGRRRREALYELLEQAAVFYRRLLDADAGKPGRELLDARRVEGHLRQAFGLGYAPPEWDALARAFTRRGVPEERLVEVGLCARSPKSGRLYDRLRNRVIFPVRDLRGRVIGFGGRDLSGEERAPKYLNSPETPLYHKGEVLYGLDLARRELRNAPALLVEGYLDVISLHGAGHPTATAPLGTALTDEQARLLGRYAGDHGVIVLFDGDAAGRSAALRSLVGLVNTGIAVRVATPPPGSDPDDVAREGGRNAVDALIDGAFELDDFIVHALVERHDYSSTTGKLELLDELTRLLLLVKERVARDLIIDRFADKLGVDERSLRLDLRRRLKENRREEAPAHRTGSHRDEASHPAGEEVIVRPLRLAQDVRLLLWLLFNDNERRRELRGELEIELFPPELRPAVARALDADLDELPPVTETADLLEPQARTALFEAVDGEIHPEEREMARRACVTSLRDRARRRELLKLRAELKEAYRRGDRVRVHELLARRQKLENS